MKFCKNLQKVADISEPEWAPYWPNYKMLKKLIKELPSLVPLDEGKAARAVLDSFHARGDSRPDSSCSRDSSAALLSAGQNHGDMTAEKSQEQIQPSQERTLRPGSHDAGAIGKSPGEIAFFKLLHSEFRKAEHFFERAMEEFTIREERVREGMNIMKQPNSIMLNAKWSLMAKGIYRLYKDLLLLETFAIMAYCSFSKILKKHDKVTGYETRIAFMTNIVNKANFTHYPHVLEMISRCESLYEDVTGNLLQEGKEGLYEDERLFISMIHRLNEQVLGSEDSQVAERKDAAPRYKVETGGQNENESSATSRLRTLLEENAKKPFAKKGKVLDAAQVSDHHLGEDDDDSDEEDTKQSTAKRPGAESPSLCSSKKRRT
mmetsp:Transcript_52263/g.79339  ORF Transcript_52263/g.79339 Transcript_52263/m.79339 type:complete len:376 (+) Transcript_52263:67-1194(+)|eukprot:CAMPEP_0117018940 /NCGR_PEP_ID=MMETSP0472-20121206/14590_1 /TAXON_ID=693140 ORGANISM="Tiarina fusus, Strain LIS" /NCGR_SAMPLE_ID=MMETSP0472 /ASSEMBLY_ACC=CAM_ASM_000603 /LENGTH=375 /DNA_ID=CAMNT_0004723751 /DNA_START=65 /DNA_END=1192 /DNA_ORIENTATION=+